MFDLLYDDIAIDLGTANILISARNENTIHVEPSIVAYNGQGKPVCIGRTAWQIHEKTHSKMRTVRPLRDGVIADFEAAEHMICQMIGNLKSKWYRSTRQMVVCVPSSITEVERQAVRNSAEAAGAKRIYLIEEPMAAAIGLGLNVHAPDGHMIVDIGGGTTEIAVIALSGIIHAKSVRLAGDRMTEDIIHYFRRSLNLLIGERTAEKIKCTVGSAAPLDQEFRVKVKGRDLVNGIPKKVAVSSREIRQAMQRSVDSITDSVIQSLEQTPPEFSSDLLERGIMLAGGGALLKNLDRRISKRTNLPVHVAEDPFTAVIRGTRAVLDSLDYYRSVLT